MKKQIILSGFLASTLLLSCVSKKKYTELEGRLYKTESELAFTNQEKDKLEEQMRAIEARVAEYNARINSLKDTNLALDEANQSLYSLEGKAPVSQKTKKQMESTLAKVSPEKLAEAQTFEDSVNLALEYNLRQSIVGDTAEEDQDDIDITIDQTVVMISVSDKLLFNTASYRINQKATPLLKKLAEVINAEPSLQVMIEGHTDPRSIQNAVLQDNWDLSVKRATSIVRALQNDYGVAPEKMIAAGRASYVPIVDNNSPENMAINRRTRIVLIPDLDMFFALL
ncbi:OmpA/MotB family protein [Algoriphagus namhaensis]